MPERDYAVVIGINQYEGFPHLKGAEHDARAFADWLKDPAGGNVPAPQISLLLSSQVGTRFEPWRDHIEQAFVPLVQRTLGPGGGDCGDRLYIFLAGHGFNDPSHPDFAALYAANASFLYSPHIAGTLYADWFLRNRAFDEIVLVMDCCRSASSLTRALPPPFPDSSNANSQRIVRRFYAFGTEWGFETRERSFGGQTRGVFSTAFLEALRNARANQNGEVMGENVKEYICDRMIELMGNTPFVPPDIRTDNSICFGVRAADPVFRVRVTLAPPAPGAQLRVTRGEDQPVAAKGAVEPVTEFTLTRGVYKLEVEGTTRSELFEIIGGDVDVSV